MSRLFLLPFSFSAINDEVLEEMVGFLKKVGYE
jgi:hypothetical protein